MWQLIRNHWDRTIAVGCAVIGLIAVLLGWVGVSGKSLPAAQIPYVISGAVFGLCALAVGATLWISADLRDEWHKLDQIQRSMTGREAAPGPDREPPGRSGGDTVPGWTGRALGGERSGSPLEQPVP